ncbi:hypothetical protein BaRGS_00016755, partial [Batillaria attramentaria]
DCYTLSDLFWLRWWAKPSAKREWLSGNGVCTRRVGVAGGERSVGRVSRGQRRWNFLFFAPPPSCPSTQLPLIPLPVHSLPGRREPLSRYSVCPQGWVVHGRWGREGQRLCNITVGGADRQHDDHTTNIGHPIVTTRAQG